MNSSKIELHEYVDKYGKNIFHSWLRKLKDKSARARIRVRVRLNRIRLDNIGDCKPIGSRISELRIDYGPGYRIYFGQDGMTIVILLCGGSKKTQSKDKKLAHQYWVDYQKRKNEKAHRKV